MNTFSLHIANPALPLGVLTACLLTAFSAWAQTPQVTTSPAQIQQNLERAIEQKPNRDGRNRPAAIDVLGLEGAESIDKLIAVQVNSPELKDAVARYWKGALGQAVSADKIKDFNAWLFKTARQQGYLSYAQTRIVPKAGGSELEVTVVRPTVRAVRVVFNDQASQERFADLLLKRIQQDVKKGQPLDLLALDQRLDTVGYDLPLELTTTVRAAGPQEIDLILSARQLESRPGQWQGGLVQLNNYGVKAFGRPQVLTSMSVEGLTPKSSLNFTGQASEGVLAYGRLQYEAPHVASDKRYRVWAATSNNRSILGGATATRGHYKEVGVGVSSLLSGERDDVFRHEAEMVVRHSDNALRSTGQTLSNVHDQQARFRATLSNERLSQNSRHLEYQTTIGNYSRLEGLGAVDHGAYAKLELNYRHRHFWDDARQIHSLVRFRGQLSSGRLDSYNQMVLGGVHGVRAYAGIDGIGDQGALVSLELNRRIDAETTAGIFYDGGVIKLLNAQPGEYAPSYALQAVGLQTTVSRKNTSLSLSLAKGIQGYKAWTSSNIDTRPDNWRLNVALTHYY